MSESPLCSECGDQNIELHGRAEWYWDSEQHDWVEHSSDDVYSYCNKCACDSPINWVDSKTYNAAEYTDVAH